MEKKLATNEMFRDAYQKMIDEKLYPSNDFERLPSLPGLGYAGLGITYQRNIEELKKVTIKSQLINEHFEPDLSSKFIGIDLPIPILPSPMSGIETNLNHIMTEYEFISHMFAGCRKFNTWGVCGDSNDSTKHYIVPELIKKYGGIATCKPRKNEIIVDKIRMLEKHGACAIGLDLDGIGGVKLFGNHEVFLKSKDELLEIRRAINVPAFVKGITSVEDAIAAYQLGYDGIVISNHGGRSVDYLPSTLEVVKEISRELKGKISIGVDGGVYSGYDVFIYLASGADVVFAGRAFLYAIISNGSGGVENLFENMRMELKKTMMVTNCRKVSDIDESKVYRKYNT